MQIPALSSLFNPTNPRVGWFAVCLKNNGVFFSHVVRANNKSRVTKCTFCPAESLMPAALEKLRKDLHVGNFQFITLLAPGDYQILMVDAPNVPVTELKTAIRWRIKDALSYHVDDATVDVLQIPTNKQGGDRPQSLYAVVAPNETIQKRIALFESARIDLKVIDIPEMAQRNIAELFEESGRGLAMLAFDESGGMLTFTSGGELFMARRIEITLGQLQDADEAMRAQYLDRVELEVQRSQDYFGRQFHHISVSRLLVSAPEHLGLVQKLSENLDLPVEALDLTQVLDISAVPELADSEFAAQALPSLGAALRFERRAL